MSRENDTDETEVPSQYEVLDATALGERLGLKRATVLTYLSRGNFELVPRPNRRLAMGPVWYEASVRAWEQEKGGKGGQEEG
jgi:predicted DNA-binding transcriptional regulator AlpA